ncbi:MAG: FtsX-like permease family protein [Lachnospiraceae bacterium]|nr:FtsX-like permease family protein [Lachnospiraceae bacterium]
MRFKDSIPFKNIINRPGRSLALAALAALLSFSVFAGTLTVRALRGGLSSLEQRMGADIMVVPAQAATKSNIDKNNIVLLGNMGYYYMDADVLDKIASREGVEEMSAQFYLSTMSTSCCSSKVQIIGFDPETDFTVTPWIRQSMSGDLGPMEVVVGNDLNAFVGDTLTFYNRDVTVAGKLAHSGTGLDTAVYANADTVKELIAASKALGLNTYKDVDPDQVVSSVLVNVSDEAVIDEVLNDINVHVRRVKAYRTKNLLEDLSVSLAGISRVAGVIVFAVWLICFAVLSLAFLMIVRERKKEFALLRAIGASKKRVSSVIRSESVMLCAFGSLCGVCLGLLAFLPFSRLIESSLDLPFLLPGGGMILLLALCAVAAALLAGLLSSALAGRGITAGDAGEMLRET